MLKVQSESDRKRACSVTPVLGGKSGIWTQNSAYGLEIGAMSPLREETTKSFVTWGDARMSLPVKKDVQLQKAIEQELASQAGGFYWSAKPEVVTLDF